MHICIHTLHNKGRTRRLRQLVGPCDRISHRPQVKSKVEDVTLKEELHSIVSAGKTRRKQQAELVQIALKKEEEKKRLDRENYRISTVPVTGQAAHEPSFYHVAGDEHDEGERSACRSVGGRVGQPAAALSVCRPARSGTMGRSRPLGLVDRDALSAARCARFSGSWLSVAHEFWGLFSEACTSPQKCGATLQIFFSGISFGT